MLIWPGRHPLARLCFGLLRSLAACSRPAPPPAAQALGVYFEIPAQNMDRAIGFYQSVLDFRFERRTIDGYEMALFRSDTRLEGATGALARGDVYVPSKSGPLIYFGVSDIDQTLQKAAARGGRTLYPKTVSSPGIVVAEFEDSEGNRIGIQSTH